MAGCAGLADQTFYPAQTGGQQEQLQVIRQRGFCLFQPCQALLQFLDGGVVTPAGVQIAVAFTADHIEQIAGVIEAVGCQNSSINVSTQPAFFVGT